MRSATRKFLVGSLLASYGVVALLGQGLHWLSAVDHHHHGLVVADCREHGHFHSHDHAHHHHGPAECEAADFGSGLHVRNAAELAACDDCEICAFLSQIKSERPHVAVAEIWQHVISFVPAALQRSYSLITFGPHAPRGPPLLLA